MKIAELNDKPVVSMADGTRVGTVKDLLVDSTGLAVTGLILGGDKGEGLLPFDQIRANGPDAITIESLNSIEWNIGRDRKLGMAMSDFRKLAVIDASGTAHGHVSEVNLSPTGRIESVEIREGGFLGIGVDEKVIPSAQIRSVGPKLMTVENVEPPKEERTI